MDYFTAATLPCEEEAAGTRESLFPQAASSEPAKASENSAVPPTSGPRCARLRITVKNA